MGSASKIKPGDVFGRLTVLKRVGWEGRSPMPRWRVKCSCGNKFELFANVLGGSEPQGRCRSCAAKERTMAEPSQLTEEDIAGVRERRTTMTMLADKYGRSMSLIRRWLDEASAETWWWVRGVAVTRISEADLVSACVEGDMNVAAMRLGLGLNAARTLLQGVEGRNAETQRAMTAWKMAKKGAKLRAIGEELGVSSKRAMQLVAWWCGRRVGERVKRVRLERLSKGGK